MALYLNIKPNHLCRLYAITLGCKLPKLYSHNTDNNTLSLETDVLDEFTSQLIQRKTDKWETKKVTSQKLTNTNYANLTDITSDLDSIEKLKTDRVNFLLQNAIEADDNITIFHLINQCIEHKKCPSLSILISVLSICSQNGNKETVLKIRDLCDELQPQVLESNSHFRHYLAEAIWVKGNITKSLEIFETVYRENAFLRRRVRLMLKVLIVDVVANRSEAALLNIVKFGEDLLKDFKDYFPLTCIWQACFLSEWFTDQCLALQLLEKNDGMCKSVVNRIPYVVTVSLRSHRTEVVYRLLEILLKYEMKLQYSAVVHALLEYQIRQRDLLRCSEIIQWTVRNNVNLPSFQHERFLKLLLKDNVEVPKPKINNLGKNMTLYKF